MKFIQYILIIIIMTIVSEQNILFGYELLYSNFTDKWLIVAAKKRAGIQEKYYQIVPPNGSVKQILNDANCPESFQWAELNTSLPLRGGLDLIDKENGHQIPLNKQKLFDETFFNKKTGKGLYGWNNLTITIVPNELYQKTVEYAKKLIDAFGFDKKLCETIDAATSNIRHYINNPSKTQKECFFKLGLMGEAAGKIEGISLCKHRDFSIFNTGKLDTLTRQPHFIIETGEGQ